MARGLIHGTAALDLGSPWWQCPSSTSMSRIFAFFFYRRTPTVGFLMSGGVRIGREQILKDPRCCCKWGAPTLRRRWWSPAVAGGVLWVPRALL